MTPEKIAKVADNVAELCQAIRIEANGNILAAVTSAPDVGDRLSGLLFAVHHIGLTLDAIGGQPLAHTVILAVEERLDDENVAVFLTRRWDGYPRLGPRLMIERNQK